jgi:hypothetical protein
MRDRLIELITKSGLVDTWNYHTDDFKEPNPIDELADYLLANGVIVPPVKIGQELWDIHYNKPRKWEVVYLGYNGKEWFINVHYYKDKHNFATRQIEGRYLNRLYFFTKEEAEQALKGGAE